MNRDPVGEVPIFPRHYYTQFRSEGESPTMAGGSSASLSRGPVKGSNYDLIEYRTFEIASYILLHHSTIRQAAEAYCISKSTAHYYIHRFLSKLDKIQYDEVCTVLNENWSDRQRRGGIGVARKKYEKKQSGT